MNFVRVSGKIGLTSLWISLASYFLSFILYIISFSLPDWIVYTAVPVKVGIWRLCDVQVRHFSRSIIPFAVLFPNLDRRL